MPQPAEQDRGGQQHQAADQVEKAEGGAALAGAGQVGHQGFFRAFGGGEEQAEGGEQRPQSPSRQIGETEHGQHGGVSQPAGGNQALAAQPVGQAG
nr:hypothetical protein [Methylogaea oryzae]